MYHPRVINQDCRSQLVLPMICLSLLTHSRKRETPLWRSRALMDSQSSWRSENEWRCGETNKTKTGRASGHVNRFCDDPIPTLAVVGGKPCCRPEIHKCLGRLSPASLHATPTNHYVAYASPLPTASCKLSSRALHVVMKRINWCRDVAQREISGRNENKTKRCSHLCGRTCLVMCRCVLPSSKDTTRSCLHVPYRDEALGHSGHVSTGRASASASPHLHASTHRALHSGCSLDRADAPRTQRHTTPPQRGQALLSTP